MSFRRLLLLLTLFLVPSTLVGFQDSKRVKDQRREEKRDYYEKWLKEDVTYIVSDQEREIFGNLSTEDEKDQFIEQFWFRRDPDPRSANNEFKEEHYRRIAYANERFASGLPGWLTDRGRIYIIHGQPAEIESRPSGGTYSRPGYEGGGDTTTYPFEVWRYRYIEGLGNDIVLEFVDPTLSGEYRLALNPEEKDALLFVPGAGLTLAEQLGLAGKADRPFFSPGNRESYPFLTQRLRDNPFERYRTFAQVQAPVPIKYTDLKEIVEVNVSYDNLPFLLGADYYRLNDDHVLVPITVQIKNNSLTFKEDNGIYAARVAVYGLVTSLTKRVVSEFEDDLQVTHTPQSLEAGLGLSSIYQKTISLDRKMRYKLDLVVKDLQSGAVGVIRRALIPPKFEKDRFLASSMVLSSTIQVLDRIPSDHPMFVLGDVKVRPNLTNSFSRKRPLGVYLQLYNAELDQTTFAPSVEVAYRVLSKGTIVAEEIDGSGESLQLASGQRLVLIRSLPVSNLPAGEYTLQIRALDRISARSVEAKKAFRLE